MSTSSQKDQAPQRTRSRARRACKNCNARRVRCNVVETQPCDNCMRTGVPCEVMTSKRGKYDRRAHASRRVAQQSPLASADSRATITADQSSLQNSAVDVTEERNSYTPVFLGIESQSPDNVWSLSPNISNPTFDATESTISKNSHDSTVFLGESNSITPFSNPNPSVTNDKRGLQYLIPDAVSAKTVTTPHETRRKATKIETLSREGAFSFPSKDKCETLFRAYFAWFHPCFPILERTEFYNSYVSNTISPLLLQAVLFVGASYCNKETLDEIGMSDRYEARSNFYNHAKDIYDADYETNRIVACQALFLMSFWRAGPLLEKDTRHWLGAAISLAQTKGMHRSSSTTSFRDAKLRKRIWWSLYVRDRQSSAALGLPIRIRDEDCDIEMLDELDFEDGHAFYNGNILGSQTQEHVSYAIQTAKLARLLGKIILREFAPSSREGTDIERSDLRDELESWEKALPLAMGSNATSDSFWAAMLHIAYNNLYILLYRSVYISSGDNTKDVGQIALQAASKNTRILEDLLAQDLIQYGHVHVITGLFNSLCIHTVHLRRSSSSAVKKLAEYRAQLCVFGLRELQNTWDVTNWVLQLYFEFLDQSLTKRLQPVENDDFTAMSRTGTSMSQSNTADVQSSEPRPIVTSSRPTQQTLVNSEWDTERHTMQSRHPVDNFDFLSHLFSSREAEDFSMFQLQPDLFAGDVFGGGLDHYYHSMISRPEDSPSPSLDPG